MSSNLMGKTILVTGASRGIGNALCKKLFKIGANVIAVTRSCDDLKALQKECPSIQGLLFDLKNWDDIKKALANVPKLDGLVNNAGVAIIKPFEEICEQDFDDTFDVNIKGLFCVTQSVSEKLNCGSSVVNVSSLASSRSFDGHCVYSATKAAVDSLTRSLAFELGPRKIRVNSVNPTVILTKMGKDNWSDPEKAEPLLDRIPLHRFGEVEEVIDAILFLLSDQSNFVNGHHLLLEGGFSAT